MTNGSALLNIQVARFRRRNSIIVSPTKKPLLLLKAFGIFMPICMAIRPLWQLIIHIALEHIHKIPKITDRVACWNILLQNCDYIVQYKKANLLPMLMRFPILITWHYLQMTTLMIFYLSRWICLPYIQIQRILSTEIVKFMSMIYLILWSPLCLLSCPLMTLIL